MFNLTPNTVFLHTILTCLSEVGVYVYESLESLTAECVDINTLFTYGLKGMLTQSRVLE